MIALKGIAGGFALMVAVLGMPAWAAEDNLAVVDEFMAAWNARDAEAAAALLTEDARYFDASMGHTTEGREAIRTDILEAFFVAFPDLEWKRAGSAPVVSESGVAFEWTFKGTNTGAMGETPATGKAVEFSGATIVQIEDGKIAYEADYYDTLGMLKQLGLM